MRFTEHELTAALHGAAKVVLKAQRGKVRKGQDVETAWQQLDRMERFRLLDGLGAQLLPVLVALPDVEVAPGTRPTYDDAVVTETVTGLLPEGTGRLKRAVLVKARVALVQTALAHVPPRRDPDGLLHSDVPEVPDSPEGL